MVDFFSSVVLLEADLVGVSAFKLECDAPRAIHMHGVSCRVKAAQGVKLKPGDIHLSHALGLVETIQNAQNATVHLCIDFRCLAGLPKFRQALALECLDHASM